MKKGVDLQAIKPLSTVHRTYVLDESLTAHYYMIFKNLFNKFPWDIFQGKYGLSRKKSQKLPKVVGH